MSSKCFGVDTSSSRLFENRESNFLILAEGPSDDIKNSFFASEKNCLILILPYQEPNVV